MNDRYPRTVVIGVNDDLVAWLRRTIEGDKALARAALGLLGLETAWHTVDKLRERGLTRADAQHVARHSSRDTIARCDAELALLDKFAEASAWYDEHRATPAGEVYGLSQAVCLLATGYQHRDGYPGETA